MSRQIIRAGADKIRRLKIDRHDRRFIIVRRAPEGREGPVERVKSLPPLCVGGYPDHRALSLGERQHPVAFETSGEELTPGAYMRPYRSRRAAQ